MTDEADVHVNTTITATAIGNARAGEEEEKEVLFSANDDEDAIDFPAATAMHQNRRPPAAGDEAHSDTLNKNESKLINDDEQSLALLHESDALLEAAIAAISRHKKKILRAQQQQQQLHVSQRANAAGDEDRDGAAAADGSSDPTAFASLSPPHASSSVSRQHRGGRSPSARGSAAKYRSAIRSLMTDAELAEGGDGTNEDEDDDGNISGVGRGYLFDSPQKKRGVGMGMGIEEEEEEGALTITASALSLRRGDQQRYTQAIRDELSAIIKHRGEIVHDWVLERLLLLQRDERRARRGGGGGGGKGIVSSNNNGGAEGEEQTARETLFRYLIDGEEAAERAALARARRAERLVPWCNNGCAYCCMSRPNWAAHVRQTTAFNAAVLTDAETRARAALEATQTARFAAMTCARGVTEQQLRLVAGQSEALRAEEFCTRGEIAVLWLHGHSALLAIHAEKKMQWDSKAYAADLRNKQVEVHREHERLHVAHIRAARQSALMCTADEASRREGIDSLETVKFHDLLNKFKYRFNEIKAEEWRREVKTALLERDALLKFKEETIRERAEALEEAQRKQKLELEREFRELRKLRKAGAQQQDVMPPCHRCQQVPAKDLSSHRLNECPERPTQCVKCETIMPMSAADGHKETCPARVLQCAHCSNFFKAAYLEEVHTQSRCAAVRDAMGRLERAQPTLRIDVTAALRGPSGHLDALDAFFLGGETLSSVVGLGGGAPPSLLHPHSQNLINAAASTAPALSNGDSIGAASGPMPLPFGSIAGPLANGSESYLSISERRPSAVVAALQHQFNGLGNNNINNNGSSSPAPEGAMAPPVWPPAGATSPDKAQHSTNGVGEKDSDNPSRSFSANLVDGGAEDKTAQGDLTAAAGDLSALNVTDISITIANTNDVEGDSTPDSGLVRTPRGAGGDDANAVTNNNNATAKNMSSRASRTSSTGSVAASAAAAGAINNTMHKLTAGAPATTKRRSASVVQLVSPELTPPNPALSAAGAGVGGGGISRERSGSGASTASTAPLRFTSVADGGGVGGGGAPLTSNSSADAAAPRPLSGLSGAGSLHPHTFSNSSAVNLNASYNNNTSSSHYSGSSALAAGLVASRLPPNATPAQVQQQIRIQTALATNSAVAEDVRRVMSNLQRWVAASVGAPESVPVSPQSGGLDLIAASTSSDAAAQNSPSAATFASLDTSTGNRRAQRRRSGQSAVTIEGGNLDDGMDGLGVGGGGVSSPGGGGGGKQSRQNAAAAAREKEAALKQYYENFAPPISVNAIPIDLPEYISPFDPSPPSHASQHFTGGVGGGTSVSANTNANASFAGGAAGDGSTAAAGTRAASAAGGGSSPASGRVGAGGRRDSASPLSPAARRGLPDRSMSVSTKGGGEKPRSGSPTASSSAAAAAAGSSPSDADAPIVITAADINTSAGVVAAPLHPPLTTRLHLASGTSQPCGPLVLTGGMPMLVNTVNVPPAEHARLLEEVNAVAAEREKALQQEAEEAHQQQLLSVAPEGAGGGIILGASSARSDAASSATNVPGGRARAPPALLPDTVGASPSVASSTEPQPSPTAANTASPNSAATAKPAPAGAKGAHAHLYPPFLPPPPSAGAAVYVTHIAGKTIAQWLKLIHVEHMQHQRAHAHHAGGGARGQSSVVFSSHNTSTEGPSAAAVASPQQQRAGSAAGGGGGNSGRAASMRSGSVSGAADGLASSTSAALSPLARRQSTIGRAGGGGGGRLSLFGGTASSLLGGGVMASSASPTVVPPAAFPPPETFEDLLRAIERRFSIGARVTVRIVATPGTSYRTLATGGGGNYSNSVAAVPPFASPLLDGSFGRPTSRGVGLGLQLQPPLTTNGGENTLLGSSGLQFPPPSARDMLTARGPQLQLQQPQTPIPQPNITNLEGSLLTHTPSTNANATINNAAGLLHHHQMGQQSPNNTQQGVGGSANVGPTANNISNGMLARAHSRATLSSNTNTNNPNAGGTGNKAAIVASRVTGAGAHSVVFFPPAVAFELAMIVGSSESASVEEHERLKFLVTMDTAQYCKPTAGQLAEGAAAAAAAAFGGAGRKGASASPARRK